MKYLEASQVRKIDFFYTNLAGIYRFTRDEGVFPLEVTGTFVGAWREPSASLTRISLRISSTLIIRFSYVIQVSHFIDGFVFLKFFHGCFEGGVKIEEDVLGTEFHGLFFLEFFSAQKLKTSGNDVTDRLSKKLSDFYFYLLKELTIHEILSFPVETFLFQSELEMKLVLKDLVPGIKEVLKFHSVSELVPGLHVGYDEAQLAH